MLYLKNLLHTLRPPSLKLIHLHSIFFENNHTALHQR